MGKRYNTKDKSDLSALRLDSLLIFLKKENKNLKRIIFKIVVPLLILSIVVQQLIFRVLREPSLIFDYHVDSLFTALTYITLFGVIASYISLYTYSDTKKIKDSQVIKLLFKMFPKLLTVGIIYFVAFFLLSKIWFGLAVAFSIIASYSLFITVFEDWKIHTIVEKNIEIIKNKEKNKEKSRYLGMLILALLFFLVTNFILRSILSAFIGYTLSNYFIYGIILNIIVFIFYTFWTVIIFSYVGFVYIEQYYNKEGIPNIVILNILENKKQFSLKTEKSTDRFKNYKTDTESRFAKNHKEKNRFKYKSKKKEKRGKKEGNRFIDDDGSIKF